MLNLNIEMIECTSVILLIQLPYIVHLLTRKCNCLIGKRFNSNSDTATYLKVNLIHILLNGLTLSSAYPEYLISCFAFNSRLGNVNLQLMKIHEEPLQIIKCSFILLNLTLHT